MKYRESFIAGFFALLLSIPCFAAGCDGWYCNGKIEYLRVNAEGNHFIHVDVGSGELSKLQCKPHKLVYISITDTENKENIISKALTAYMARKSVIVFTNQDSGPCVVEELLLGSD